MMPMRTRNSTSSLPDAEGLNRAKFVLAAAAADTMLPAATPVVVAARVRENTLPLYTGSW